MVAGEDVIAAQARMEVTAEEEGLRGAVVEWAALIAGGVQRSLHGPGELHVGTLQLPHPQVHATRSTAPRAGEEQQLLVAHAGDHGLGAVPGPEAFELLRWAVPVAGPFAGHDVAGAVGRTVGEVEEAAVQRPRRVGIVAAAVHRVGQGFGLGPATRLLPASEDRHMVFGGVLHHAVAVQLTAQAAQVEEAVGAIPSAELAVVGVHRIGQVLHEQAVAGSAGQAHRAALQSLLRPLVLEAGWVLVLPQQLAPGFLRLAVLAVAHAHLGQVEKRVRVGAPVVLVLDLLVQVGGLFVLVAQAAGLRA